MKALRTILIVSAVALFASCSKQPQTKHEASASGSIAGNLTTPASADDGQWLMAAKDYANTRYSNLDQINTGNVANLKVAWTFSTGTVRGNEGAPLVVGDRMYVVTPFPNILYALDLKNNGTLLWSYDPKASPAAQGVASATSLIEERPTGTGAFTTTLSMAIVSPSMPRQAKKSGRRSWPSSPMAKPSQWRPWW